MERLKNTSSAQLWSLPVSIAVRYQINTGCFDAHHQIDESAVSSFSSAAFVVLLLEIAYADVGWVEIRRVGKLLFNVELAEGSEIISSYWVVTIDSGKQLYKMTLGCAIRPFETLVEVQVYYLNWTLLYLMKKCTLKFIGQKWHAWNKLASQVQVHYLNWAHLCLIH